MYKYLLYFLIFSFLGWCAEVIFHLLKEGAFVNRGLAKGPICPIYGVGICLIDLLLGSIDSFLLLALLSMAVATAVELLVGYFTDHFLSPVTLSMSKPSRSARMSMMIWLVNARRTS